MRLEPSRARASSGSREPAPVSLTAAAVNIGGKYGRRLLARTRTGSRSLSKLWRKMSAHTRALATWSTQLIAPVLLPPYRCPGCAGWRTRRRLAECEGVIAQPLHRRRVFATGCPRCGLLFATPRPTGSQMRSWYSETGEWASTHAGFDRRRTRTPGEQHSGGRCRRGGRHPDAAARRRPRARLRLRQRTMARHHGRVRLGDVRHRPRPQDGLHPAHRARCHPGSRAVPLRDRQPRPGARHEPRLAAEGSCSRDAARRLDLLFGPGSGSAAGARRLALRAQRPRAPGGVLRRLPDDDAGPRGLRTRAGGSPAARGRALGQAPPDGGATERTGGVGAGPAGGGDPRPGRLPDRRRHRR